MADVNDISAAIAHALDEIGVTGTLDVTKDGAEESKTLGVLTGDDLKVRVEVEDA